MTAGLKCGITFAVTLILIGVFLELGLTAMATCLIVLFCIEFILLPWMVEAFGGTWGGV